MKLPKRNKMDNKNIINLNYEHKYSAWENGVKPSGFWYGCYDSWYKWTTEEGMFVKKYIHQINLKYNVLTDIRNKDNDKLLVIKNLKDFDLFNKRYGYSDYYGNNFPENITIFSSKTENLLKNKSRTKFTNIYHFDDMYADNLIKWEKVMKDYGGIEICPYLEKRRHYLWYSSFDVTSGCIWNLKPILKDTKLIYKLHRNKYVKV